MPNYEGIWEICKKIPLVRKQRMKKTNPNPWYLLRKMEEMEENTDGNTLCAVKVNTYRFCKKKSIAIKFYLDISTLIVAILVFFVLSVRDD